MLEASVWIVTLQPGIISHSILSVAQSEIKWVSIKQRKQECLFWPSCSGNRAVYRTSKRCWRGRLWFRLLCVYPRLFNQETLAHRVGCWQDGKRGLDYSPFTKWGRMGLILFGLRHLSQLYSPISSLKREKSNGGQGGGRVTVAENTSVPSWWHKTRELSNVFILIILVCMYIFQILWLWKLLTDSGK